MKVQVEGMARAETTNNSLSQKAIEEVLLRFKTEDETEETVNTVEDEETEESVNWIRNKINWRKTRGSQRRRGNTSAISTSMSGGRGRGERKCYTCEKEGHIARFCPIKQKILESQKSEATFTGLVTNDNENKQMNSSNETDESIFTVRHNAEETELKAKRDWIDVILDTGATKSVIGEENLRDIREQQTNNPRWEMKEKPEKQQLQFKFGDGKTIKQAKQCIFP